MLYDSYTGCTSCGQKNCCDNCMRGITVLIGIVAGIIFGAAFTLLYAFSFLPLAIVAISVAAAIAIIYLILVFIGGIIAGASSSESKLKECLCCNVGSIFFGIFGTIIFGILALAADILTLSTIGIIFVGLTTFFFAYMLTTIFFLIRCFVCR